MFVKIKQDHFYMQDQDFVRFQLRIFLPRQSRTMNEMKENKRTYFSENFATPYPLSQQFIESVAQFRFRFPWNVVVVGFQAT